MNGPEHYAAAERLITRVNDERNVLSADQQRTVLTAAQVHATLALTAATIDAAEGQPGHRNGSSASGTVAMQPEWDEVTT